MVEPRVYKTGPDFTTAYCEAKVSESLFNALGKSEFFPARRAQVALKNSKK